MTIRDNFLIFSDAQAVTTATATPSTNVIDLHADKDFGKGEPLEFVISVNTLVAASGGAANVTFALQTDNDEAFGSATTLWTSAAIAKGTLVAGYVVIKTKLFRNTERYLRVVYTPDTNDLTAGKFDAWICKDVDDRRNYPKNYAV
jgi:hypothetical protein